MHSAIIAVIAAVSGLSHAAVIKRNPLNTTTECSGSGSYYVCSTNGFRGRCSVDPCEMKWCPDFDSKTCEPAKHKPKGTGTCTTTTTTTAPPVVTCPPGTGFYQACANGFRGCCKYDACSNPHARCEPGCPEGRCSTTLTITTTITPTITATPYPAATDAEVTSTASPSSSATASSAPVADKRQAPQVECPGKGNYYVCGNNNFRGYCSVDPCAISWCPDFEPKTCNPKTSGKTDTSEEVVHGPTEVTYPPTPATTSDCNGVPLKAGEVCVAPIKDSLCPQAGTPTYFQKCKNGSGTVSVCANIDFCGRRAALGLY